jgi:hypothetical protein
MTKPTKNVKGSAWKGTKWLWFIPLLVAASLVLNHYYQWYTWPWIEPAPLAKKQIETKDFRPSPPEPTKTEGKLEKKQIPTSVKTEGELARKLPPASAKTENKLPKKQVPEPGKTESRSARKQLPVSVKTEGKKMTKPAPAAVIDYEKIKKKPDKSLKELVQKRKKEFGVKKSVDMVVKPGEHIRVGKEIIPLDLILAQIKTQKNDQQTSLGTPSQPEEPSPERVAHDSPGAERPIQKESRLNPAPVASQDPHKPLRPRPLERPVSYYGIYVVRSGDNLWDIHFAFLREYFGARGIRISSNADQPRGSASSGVGRILKYAETMVYIFNLKTKTLSTDLNSLKPKEKVVIFNLSALDEALAPLTYRQVNRIRFDGRDLISTAK